MFIAVVFFLYFPRAYVKVSVIILTRHSESKLNVR